MGSLNEIGVDMSLPEGHRLDIETAALHAVRKQDDESMMAFSTAVRAAMADGASLDSIAYEADLSIVLVEKAAGAGGRSGGTGWLLVFDE